jgi:uncharacterized protein YjbJ (UPF0337 family)
MLNLLNDYVATLNTEIASYEALIAKKRAELEQLTQLQGQVVEALGTLKDVVDQLKDKDPKAIATIKEAAVRIFEYVPPLVATDSNALAGNETTDGALYLAKKAEPQEEHSQVPISDTESTVEPKAEGDDSEYDADMVRIVTDRFNGAFNGIVGKVTKRSNFGAQVLLPSNEEKFFLERELEQSLDEVPF